MTTTPHDGTKYTDPSWSTPAETETAVLAGFTAAEKSYKTSMDTTEKEFAKLAGIPAPQAQQPAVQTQQPTTAPADAGATTVAPAAAPPPAPKRTRKK